MVRSKCRGEAFLPSPQLVTISIEAPSLVAATLEMLRPYSDRAAFECFSGSGSIGSEASGMAG